MRPFLLLTITIIVTGILANTYADSSTPQERWEGYRSADSSEVQNLNLPFQDFAENAVFEMQTIGMTRTPGERFDVVDIESAPQVTDPTVLSNRENVVPFQIETCRKQGLRYCPVLSYSNTGTMFFNRGRFHTCRHGFHNWITLASQLNGNRSVSTITPPMILRAQRNGQSTVVYNSGYEGKPQMQFSTINDDPRLNYQTYSTTHPTRSLAIVVAQSDYVEMTLTERISRDYALTTRTNGINNLRVNEEAFLVGYPLQTDTFSPGAGDSPGRELMISNGLALRPWADFALMETTNYTTAGLSGGPVVSASGELAGMNCMTGQRDNPADVRSRSYPIDRTLMTNYWRTLPYPSEAEMPNAMFPDQTTVEQ